MKQVTINQQIFRVLQVSIAMCCIGHGAFGIITKPIWCNYFSVFGIGHDLAYQLMPLVGSVDIALGIVMLLYPVRAIALWLIAWGFITASLRPLSGEPFAELIERAGNFGAPLALILLLGVQKNIRQWFIPIDPGTVRYDEKTKKQVAVCLKIVVFLLLAGHGWLNLIHKKSLLDQYSGLGFSGSSISVANTIGWMEVTAALAILAKPAAPLLLFLLVWKVFSELFYPHYEIFEWIERGGSYGCLLALYLITRNMSRERKNKTDYLQNMHLIAQ